MPMQVIKDIKNNLKKVYIFVRKNSSIKIIHLDCLLALFVFQATQNVVNIHSFMFVDDSSGFKKKLGKVK